MLSPEEAAQREREKIARFVERWAADHFNDVLVAMIKVTLVAAIRSGKYEQE